MSTIDEMARLMANIDDRDLGVIIVDSSNLILFLNRQAERIWSDAEGRSLNELDPQPSPDLISLGSSGTDWAAVSHSDDWHIIRKIDMSFTSEKFSIFLIFPLDKMLADIPETLLYRYALNEIQSIIDCIQDGIYITDGNGVTLMINEASKKYCSGLDMPLEEMVGKSVSEFVKKGYWDESITLQVLEAKKTVSRMQTLQNNIELLTTGVPYFKNGKITKVVTTEREMTELADLRKQLQENASITKKYESELEYYRSQSRITEDIVYRSDNMKAVISDALKAAKQDVTILIQGESGTGKELLANLIVRNSARNDSPFIKINCASIPENLLESELFGYDKGSFTGANSEGKIGIFELANNGTLFLDEIAEIPVHVQSKLLRAIQEGEILRIGGRRSIAINVRIIAATNINLRKAVDDGRFRGDLFYRLNIFPIVLPPLRNRKADIRDLALFYITQFNKKYKVEKTIDENALAAFSRYEWPGNVRELKNVIERLFISIDTESITAKHVTSQLCNEPMIFETTLEGASYSHQVEQFEKALLKNALAESDSLSAAARHLKLSKSTVSKKCKKFDIPIQRDRF